MAAAHTALVNAVMLAVQRRVPAALVVKVETGATLARCPHCRGGLPVRAYGVVGSCDMRGYLPGGVPFEVECKVGKDRLRPAQKTWQAALEKLGVLHVVARAESVLDVTRAANDAADLIVGRARQADVVAPEQVLVRHRRSRRGHAGVDVAGNLPAATPVDVGHGHHGGCDATADAGAAVDEQDR